MASIVALRMIKALVRLGWSVDRASGTSHHVLTKAGHQPITVPVKKGRTLKDGTARAILRQAGSPRTTSSTSTEPNSSEPPPLLSDEGCEIVWRDPDGVQDTDVR